MRNIQQLHIKVATERDTLMEGNLDLRKALDKVHGLLPDATLSINGRRSNSKGPYCDMPSMENLEQSGIQTADDPDTNQDTESHMAGVSIVPGPMRLSAYDAGDIDTDTRTRSSGIEETSDYLQATVVGDERESVHGRVCSSVTCDEEIFSTPQAINTDITTPDHYSQEPCSDNLLDRLDRLDTNFFRSLVLLVPGGFRHDRA